MKIDKLFDESGIIFCSVKKINSKNNKLIKINNNKLFKLFIKNHYLMRKKILNHIKKNKFNIYGAGGSMALAMASIPEMKNNINKIFDSDPAKLHYKFPGTKKKILANKKVYISNNFPSISNYDLKKKNNLNIQKI